MNYREYIEYIFNMMKIIWKRGDCIVIVKDGNLFCIDLDMSMLYTIKLNIPLEFNLCTYYSIVKEYLSTDNSNMLTFKYYEFNTTYCRVLNIINNFNNSPDKFIQENINTDETIKDYFYLKSSDPSYSFVKNNVYIPMFYGIVPIAKGDAVDLQIANMNSYSTVKYTVIKKNNKDIIDIYMNVINL